MIEKVLIWIDFEKGWMCLEEKRAGEHYSYNYSEFTLPQKKEGRQYPPLSSTGNRDGEI